MGSTAIFRSEERPLAGDLAGKIVGITEADDEKSPAAGTSSDGRDIDEVCPWPTNKYFSGLPLAKKSCVEQLSSPMRYASHWARDPNRY
jgi:hypothetical protein